MVRAGSSGDAGVGAGTGAGEAVGAVKGEAMRPGYARRRRSGGQDGGRGMDRGRPAE
ncbi:hypothetical protein GCM10009718_36420 [Isoptericola halotolerans]